MYWFGAAAQESSLIYDAGVPKYFVYVFDTYEDNQVLVRFTAPTRPCLIDTLSALISYSRSGDTASTFALSVRRDTGGMVPGAYLSLDTQTVRWEVDTTQWAKVGGLGILINDDSSFWGTLHWMSYSPTSPRIGDDWSSNSGRNFVGFAGNYAPYFGGGNRMLRAKVLVNNPASENAGSFWIYRGTDSNSVFHIATVDSGEFSFLDSPPATGDYYYRVSRWQGGVESPLSNSVLLPASPTGMEDREVGKHAFLLSEPFPNPTSASVLFSARTDKQMPLGFSIYNLLGQKVFSRPAAAYPAGEHQFFWNGRDDSGRRLSSGLYLLRFQAGEEVLVKKITLLR
ncbi:MAG: T9SS type A sorting domain-containing protein [candidate division Zixibacteria bacterium]|nr:T9SS type A sorting domain-containing protein [candidate division Zixibacteria bacterium]